MHLIESFEIDDGSVSDLRPERCFVLGVEWQDFRSKLKGTKPFSALIHAENAGRLVRLAERSGRFFDHFTSQPGWVHIIVGDRKT